jgi:hypothetical protein
MANISDQFASELMAHSIDLARFEAGERDKLLVIFRDLEAELVDRLRRSAPDEPTLSVYQRQRAERLLTDVRTVIAGSYRSMATTLRRDLKVLAITEAEGIQSLGAEMVVDGLFSTLPSEAVLRAMVDDLIIQGTPLQEWWSKQASTTLQRYGDTIRQGLVRGDSTTDMVRALRGTQAARFEDGVFGRSRRDVTTLVRTSVNSVSSQARIETFRENEDVLKGWEWLTALDGNVCPRCTPYSGQAWTLDGTRLPGTKLVYPGPPPLHPS